METLKSIGGALLGIMAFIAIIIVTVLFFAFGTALAFTIAPFINWLAGTLLAINILVLLVAIVPRARGVAGIIIYISSYVYGLSLWIYGLAVTLSLWGFLAVIIGLFLGGVGVVPIGMLAAIFNGRWSIFFSLLFMLVLTYGSRIVGGLLASNFEEKSYEKRAIIDVEAEDTKRTWEDIEE